MVGIPSIIVDSMKKIMSKYDFVAPEPRDIGTDTLTVPDLVLSMREIYLKYVATGDISSLPGMSVHPQYDNMDLDDDVPEFDIEERVDSHYNAMELRESARQAERSRLKGLSGQEDIQSNAVVKDDEHSESSATIREKPASVPPAYGDDERAKQSEKEK